MASNVSLFLRIDDSSLSLCVLPRDADGYGPSWRDALKRLRLGQHNAHMEFMVVNRCGGDLIGSGALSARTFSLFVDKLPVFAMRDAFFREPFRVFDAFEAARAVVPGGIEASFNVEYSAPLPLSDYRRGHGDVVARQFIF